MFAYIALEEMQIVAQRKTICRNRILQPSYTWKEAIGNFCTPTSPTNFHISEGQTMHKG